MNSSISAHFDCTEVSGSSVLVNFENILVFHIPFSQVQTVIFSSPLRDFVKSVASFSMFLYFWLIVNIFKDLGHYLPCCSCWLGYLSANRIIDTLHNSSTFTDSAKYVYQFFQVVCLHLYTLIACIAWMRMKSCWKCLRIVF